MPDHFHDRSREHQFRARLATLRRGDEVHVQSHLIFLQELDHDFDASAPWNSIQGYETTDEDGNKISEWSVGVSDLAAFLGQADG